MDDNYEDYDDVGDTNGSVPRRRNKHSDDLDPDHADAGIYNDLQRLRSLVNAIEGDSRKSTSCFQLGLNNSVMSTIFGLVFVVLMTVTFYAFFSLYKAISKRFFQDI